MPLPTDLLLITAGIVVVIISGLRPYIARGLGGVSGVATFQHHSYVQRYKSRKK